ncbi:hypothetical protein [Arthrobacter wenxiniae]|uniref:Uncharacterized protein n=1 Tax=Arthrobacter wenxiniae TaxID=2713570 RepID=A0A7Y7LZ28_9MICC|nr:hypothetical protein [Arthrobacter wenxiniae]NVM96100.1 hypothetical protein [Arthrobacter wenxiniae]
MVDLDDGTRPEGHAQPEEGAHPEWDLFYARGLSGARIAEVTGTPIGTVKRHLERRRAVDPGLDVEHNAVLRRPSKRWLLRLAEVLAFIRVYDRYPIIHSGEWGEASLYVWLAEQRRAFLAQNLSWRKAEVLGDWVTTDRERVDDERWRQRLGETVDFVAAEGRLPRHRMSQSVSEHVLGIWMQTQGIETHHGRRP